MANYEQQPDTNDSKRYEYSKNTLIAANLELDRHVDNLQRAGIAMQGIPDFSHEIDNRREKIRHLVYGGNTHPSVSWNDTFRLRSHFELLDEIVYTPIVFSYGTAKEQLPLRRTLIDGVLGINTSLIESALEQYDHPDISPQEREELQGVIHELTAPTLLNHQQIPTALALPAPARDDLMEKTDILYYTAHQHGYSALPIQVKSSYPKEGEGNQVPKGGILVTSRHMGNSVQNNFMTARALVAEIQGQLTPRQAEHLDLFSRHFVNHVRSEAEAVRAQQTDQQAKQAA